MPIQVLANASISVLCFVLSKALHHLRIYEVLTESYIQPFMLNVSHEAYWRMITSGDNAFKKLLIWQAVTIFRDCSPSDPLALWLEFRANICDDIHHTLQSRAIINNPTEDQVFDYGLYLINRILRAGNKELGHWPAMPLPQFDWNLAVANRLVADQRSYHLDEQAQLATQRLPTLNIGQRAAFDAIVTAVENKSGKTFFLHGPGGTGKTYVYNTLYYFLRGQGKIVLCFASSGIASLLLIGGRTSHSTFKIPINIDESSVCRIKKDSDLGELIHLIDLVIWDEAPMQHRHIHEAVDPTFRDIRDCEHKVFGGL